MRWFRVVLVACLIGTGLASVFAAENALHIWNRPQPDPRDADVLVRGTGAVWQAAQVTAVDGVRLDGWVFTPRAPNGAAAILLHGVSDSRMGVQGQTRFLLRAGYTVLAPDARGHGSSGGDIITYGIREAGDVHAWADWLFQNRPVRRLYGLGESMGAAILLESLPREPRFRAVVAECPFATFQEVAYDRMSQETGMPAPVFWPIIHLGFAWARLRHRVDLGHASPLAAVRSTGTPVLLIHGIDDTNIPIRHSRELHAANPATELWEVRGAGHVASLSTAPEEYEGRVLRWFGGH